MRRQIIIFMVASIMVVSCSQNSGECNVDENTRNMLKYLGYDNAVGIY